MNDPTLDGQGGGLDLGTDLRLVAHPQHARTPEQQAEYERQGRLADERARIAWMERRRREREEDERGEETP
jgi:hypothetical protein